MARCRFWCRLSVGIYWDPLKLIETPSGVTPGNASLRHGFVDILVATPSVSQAGRRRFDPGRPLSFPLRNQSPAHANFASFDLPSSGARCGAGYEAKLVEPGFGNSRIEPADRSSDLASKLDVTTFVRAQAPLSCSRVSRGTSSIAKDARPSASMCTGTYSLPLRAGVATEGPEDERESDPERHRTDHRIGQRTLAQLHLLAA